jgi:WD40 repeat protein
MFIAVTLLGLSSTSWSQTSQNANPSVNSSNGIVSVQFSPDGKQVITGSTNRAVRIWDVTNGKQLSNPATHLGTWQLVSFKYNDAENWSEAPKDQRRIRLVTETHFTWVNYETANGKAQTMAGGTYTFSEGKYIETIDFAGEGMTEYLGKKQAFTIRVEGDKWHQSGQLSDGTRIEEVWERVK